MPNLSQIKCQRMLDFLNKLRGEHKDGDSTLIALGEVESELNAEKYGLVWEQHEEAVDVQMRTHITVFTEDEDREITTVPYEVDFLIQRENDTIPVEVKSDTNITNKSLKKYKELFGDKSKLSIRFSLNNLKLDDDVLNIPFFMADHAD